MGYRYYEPTMTRQGAVEKWREWLRQRAGKEGKPAAKGSAASRPAESVSEVSRPAMEVRPVLVATSRPDLIATGNSKDGQTP